MCLTVQQQKKGSRGLVGSLVIALGLLQVLLTVGPARAAGEEETIARNFLKFLRSDKAILSTEIFERNLLDPGSAPVAVGQLFHLQGGGYIIVSADRSVSPVKAYSLRSDFAALPEPYRQALLAELELRVRIAATGAGRTPLAATPSETERQWDFLLNFDASRMPLAYTAGTNLLGSRWNQGYPYNKFLPAVEGQTVLSGCVNVAVGQVLRYHRYPAASRGVISYAWDGPPTQTLKTILYRRYNWDNMPETINAATPEYQTDEVALLMKDLGIANRTDFDFTGSSTYLQSNVLVENFGYSTSLAKMDNTDYAAFLATLQAEIAAERPVLLTFPTHMTVADGYSADNSGQKIHVNMGWGGSADDYYFLNEPVQAGGYIFPIDAGYLDIYYNIKPCSGSDCATNLETGDGLDGLAVAGNFDQAKDKDEYEIYLKGPTTLSAARGYSNLGFFASIISMAGGSVTFPAPDPVATSANVAVNAGDLPAGKYLLRVALCNDSGTLCYAPAVNFNHYTVSLTTASLTAEERATIDQALDKAPVIGNAFPDLILNVAAPVHRILIDARDENGDTVVLSVANSNPAAVSAVLNGNMLELTPTGLAKVASRIEVTAAANGQSAVKAFTVLTDSGETGFGKTFTVGGTFASQEDVRTHRVILDSACTILGDRGYSNQAFYSSVVDATGHVVVPMNEAPINYAFPPGVYWLRASLEQNPGGGGSYYPYEEGVHTQYAFTVNCPSADTGTATIAGLLGIDLAGAELPILSPGDVNGDGVVNMVDAVIVLQLLQGMDMTGISLRLEADVAGDGRIGPAEALFILQKAAGLRLP